MSEKPEQIDRGWPRYVVWAVVLLVVYPLSIGPAAAVADLWMMQTGEEWPVVSVLKIVYFPLIFVDERLHPNRDSLLLRYCQYCQSFVE